MADIDPNDPSVIPQANAVIASGIAGATIIPGDVLYIDTADSDKLKLADADAASPAYIVAGIALHGAFAGQPIRYVTDGDVGIGTLTFPVTPYPGEIYILSATPGKLAPCTDRLAGWFITVVGIGGPANGKLRLFRATTGVALNYS